MRYRGLYIFFAAVVVAAAIGGWYYLYNSAPPQASSLSETPSVLGQEQSSDTATPQEPTKAPKTQQKPMTDTIRVTFKTSHGDVALELFPKEAPLTVENFVKLARAGFYDGTRFHRVIKGFMIQGGDPYSRDDDWSNDGTGGPGYTFKDEINAHKIVRGALAMANAGPDTNGSQFFIVTTDAAPWLDGKHTVFGRVTAGMETVDKIENVKTDKARGDHPIQNVTINAIEITEQYGDYNTIW